MGSFSLKEKVNGIQNKLCFGDNPFLVDLERQLMEELNEVLIQEEYLWKQNTKCDWLKEGYRNTSFFICALLLGKGKIRLNFSRIIMVAVEYFQHLFTAKDVSFDKVSLPNLFPVISEKDSNFLCRNVKDLEIRYALFNIGAWKSPGPNGFPATLFKRYWDIFGYHICEMVGNVFSTGQFPKGLNETFISIILKVNCSQDMSNFRLTSLCNNLYKVINKVLV